MEVNNISLEATVVKREQYPEEFYPEIAFVGKSNVGKSSLINVMVNRKSLARTSQNPGKTRTINFYNVENVIRFVDLPGYGYAKASKSEIEKWGSMIESYLKIRKTLKSIILLIDIRHEPSKNDIMMYEWLRYYNYDMIIVASKADKLKRSQVPRHIAMLRSGLKLPSETVVIPFSSETRAGKEELWNAIEEKAGLKEAE